MLYEVITAEGRLSRAVRADDAVELSFLYLEIQVFNGGPRISYNFV